jgi:hypothetical protein
MEGLRASEKTSRPYKMHGFDAGGVTHEDKLCLVSLGAAKCGFLLTSLAQGKEGSTGLYTVSPRPGPHALTATLSPTGARITLFVARMMSLRDGMCCGRLPPIQCAMHAEHGSAARVVPGADMGGMVCCGVRARSTSRLTGPFQRARRGTARAWRSAAAHCTFSAASTCAGRRLQGGCRAQTPP